MKHPNTCDTVACAKPVPTTGVRRHKGDAVNSPYRRTESGPHQLALHHLGHSRLKLQTSSPGTLAATAGANKRTQYTQVAKTRVNDCTDTLKVLELVLRYGNRRDCLEHAARQQHRWQANVSNRDHTCDTHCSARHGTMRMYCSVLPVCG
jgi:hypothetical protein